MRTFAKSEAVAARRDLFAEMLDSGGAPKTGLTLTVTIVKAGGTAFGAIGGSSSEIETTGTYKISLAAADLDTEGEAMIRIVAAGAVTQTVPIAVRSFPNDAALARKMLLNKKVKVLTTGVLTLYDDNGTTELKILTPSTTVDDFTVTPSEPA